MSSITTAGAARTIPTMEGASTRDWIAVGACMIGAFMAILKRQADCNAGDDHGIPLGGSASPLEVEGSGDVKYHLFVRSLRLADPAELTSGRRTRRSVTVGP